MLPLKALGAAGIAPSTGGGAAEPSGAASVAAVVSGKLVLSGPTTLVVSGGNVDPAVYAQLVT